MKTIVITAYHGFIGRNIFSSAISDILKSQNDARVVVLTSPSRKDYFTKEYGGGNFIIEAVDLEPIVRTGKSKFWYRLAFFLQNSRYVKDQRKERFFRNRNLAGYLNFFWINFTAGIFSRLPLVRKKYRFFDGLFSPKNTLDDLIENYKPDLFFLTDIFGEHDVFVSRCAASKKIKIVGMVRSWDNTTTKGILRFFPDYLIAGSPAVLDELGKFHDWKNKNQTLISGLPQFDSWPDGPTLSRNEFFSKIGADPKKRLILFAPAGSILSDTDWQIADILKEALKEGLLPDDLVFLIRNHPHHPADFSKFQPDKHFIIEFPGTELRKGDSRGAEISRAENEHLLNSVYYSQMVMYVATSLGLDASIFDKPQILISFDGWEEKPYEVSVRRYNQEDCLANLASLGGTMVVENKEELIAAINLYLEHPELDREGRKKTIERHLYKLDGKAGERIANYIYGL